MTRALDPEARKLIKIAEAVLVNGCLASCITQEPVGIEHVEAL